MRLHEDPRTFRQAIQATADRMNLPAIYVEKDYWVTYTLFIIFHHDIGKDVVFKGGTALSKCYQLIERFSEDIDLVVLRHEGETDSKLKSKLKEVSHTVSAVLPEISIVGITQKMGMNRKTAHSYNKEFEGQFGQVRDMIILESTWLGHSEPRAVRSIISFVGQMMLDNGQLAIAQQNGLLPFELPTLEPTRTICEKVMSLVRFSYADDPIDVLKKKIRHTYDLHQLLQRDEFLEFFHSEAFDTMLLKVAGDDVLSYRNNNLWLNNHPNDALIFRELEQVWSDLRSVYHNEFRFLVYGVLPEDEAILETLRMIQARLSTIQWTIDVKPEE